MKIVLLRVGIDSGCGGIQGPLLDSSLNFEYIPIPDGTGTDSRTYGSEFGEHGRKLVDYFPLSRRETMVLRSIHYDPEFRTFTYGDPTSLKARLRYLEPGDMLIFYCGLEGWGGYQANPMLYVMGYFEVALAGRVSGIGELEVQRQFSKNFHVRHPRIYSKDEDRLVLVKGGRGSRLLNTAVLISQPGEDRRGRPLKVLSREMRHVFGDFEGRVGIQRSSPRWVRSEFVESAAQFMRSLD